ncbi:MAG: hypothetical protein ACRD0S_12490, partial [Acidimicrobiales bacterium]
MRPMHSLHARRPNARAVSAAVVSALLALSPLLREPAYGAPADLDGGFGAAGLVTTPLGVGLDEGEAVG